MEIDNGTMHLFRGKWDCFLFIALKRLVLNLEVPSSFLLSHPLPSSPLLQIKKNAA